MEHKPPSEAQAVGGTPKLTRTDAQINFNWDAGSPVTQIKSKDTYAVRQLETRYGENNAFHVEADAGFRVWIEAQLVSGYWPTRGRPSDTRAGARGRSWRGASTASRSITTRTPRGR